MSRASFEIETSVTKPIGPWTCPYMTCPMASPRSTSKTLHSAEQTLFASC
jgi:hypothetical protein